MRQTIRHVLNSYPFAILFIFTFIVAFTTGTNMLIGYERVMPLEQYLLFSSIVAVVMGFIVVKRDRQRLENNSVKLS